MEEQLSLRKRFMKVPLDDLVGKDNPIIPEGRERIFCKGIERFIRGEFYEAIYILAPQTENLFRNIAKEVGGLTITINKDGVSEERVLGTIFKTPELVDSYDNDILFLFQGLLNEKAGANIRNEVAHGIFSESRAASGASLFFGAAVIKLLALTSTSVYEILRDSKPLRNIRWPDRELIKIKKVSANKTNEAEA